MEALRNERLKLMLIGCVAWRPTRRDPDMVKILDVASRLLEADGDQLPSSLVGEFFLALAGQNAISMAEPRVAVVDDKLVYVLPGQTVGYDVSVEKGKGRRRVVKGGRGG